MVLQVPAVLGRYRREVEEELRARLASRSRGPYAMVRYHLGWTDERGEPAADGGGKALRPSLCLLACEAAGGDYRGALPAAAAVELVHNFSLIHDDIQDGDSERRHRPTVWRLWGVGQGINAGDVTWALAMDAVYDLSRAGLPAEQVLAAARCLNNAATEMIEGQYLDLSYEERLDIGVDAYLAMTERKTGALLGSALELGALAAGADPATRAAFRRCGRLLGVAFQARDDYLGVWGEGAHTGKSSLGDLLRKKKSLPVVYGFQAASGPDRERLGAYYRSQRQDAAEAHAVRLALERAGAAEYTQQLAQERKEEALSALDGLDLVEAAAAELRDVADFLLEREF